MDLKDKITRRVAKTPFSLHHPNNTMEGVICSVGLGIPRSQAQGISRSMIPGTGPTTVEAHPACTPLYPRDNHPDQSNYSGMDAYTAEGQMDTERHSRELKSEYVK